MIGENKMLTNKDVKILLMNLENETNTRINLGIKNAITDQQALVSFSFDLEEIPDDHLFFDLLANKINENRSSNVTKEAFETIVSDFMLNRLDASEDGIKNFLNLIYGIGVLNKFR